LQIATYNQTIRVNAMLVNHEVGVVQPDLSAARGVESPTFVTAAGGQRPGLYHVPEWDVGGQ
jgi:Domain of unknown function (DUF5919)